LTGYQTFKQPNYLIIISLYRDRDKAHAHRDGKYCAIPGGPPGQLHAHNRDNQPDGLRRVTQTPSTAVPLAASWEATDPEEKFRIILTIIYYLRIFVT
jgi:hypothetical protein